MSEELKPCPFCGGAASCDTTFPNDDSYHVTCLTEPCAGNIFRPNWSCASKAQAIAAWNRRSREESLEIALSALVAGEGYGTEGNKVWDFARAALIPKEKQDEQG